LRSEKTQPVSRYTSYEGIVTALAFANKGTMIAFCVRERAVHRLYVADAERLDTTLTLVQEYSHKKPWINPDGDAGAPGVTSIAFTQDDRMLVAHGRYEEELYKLTAWSLVGEAVGSIQATETFRRENKEKPFLSERSSRPIRFVQRPGDNVLIAEDDSRFVMWNLTTGQFGEIPFLPMQKGLPERNLSDDGKWLIMGDDRGNVFVWDVIGGEKYSVAHAVESAITVPSTIDRKKTPADMTKSVFRPAHSGPVVGVVLSPAGLHGEFPEFAATIGEENRIIVWDLIPVLGKKSTIPSKTAKRTSTQ